MNAPASTTVAVLAAPDDPRLARFAELAADLGSPTATCSDPTISVVAGHLTTDQAAAIGDYARTVELDLLIRPPLAAGARRLVLLDVDSTMIRQEVIELLADEAGCGDQVAAITARAMAGELDFTESLTERVALLAGLDAGAIESARRQMQLTPGAERMVASLHADGHLVGVVSGGFSPFTDHLQSLLHLDFARANTLEIVDDRLTGRVLGDIVDQDAKTRFLIEQAAGAGIDLAQTVAVGDGANDLGMIGAAGVGIAFCAKPVVRAAAAASISVPRLDAVPGLLGVPLVGVDADLSDAAR